MAKKNEVPDSTNPFDGVLSGAVKGSAQQVWLAGLGALAKAQQEGGRVFEALVKEGTLLQRQNPSAVGAKFAEAAARLSGLGSADEGIRPTAPWDRLETIFEERVAKALTRLGIPTEAEVKALQARIDALSARLDAREPATMPARKASAKAASSKTATAKRAPTRKRA